jgi:ribosomal protein L31
MKENTKEGYFLIRDIDANYKDSTISSEKKVLNSTKHKTLTNINDAIREFNNLMTECELIQIKITENNHPSYTTIARKKLVLLDQNSIKYKPIIVNASVIKDATEKIDLD